MISDKMESTIYVRKITIFKIHFLVNTFHSGQNVLVWIRLCEYLRNEHYVDDLMSSLPKPKKLTNIYVVRFKDKIRWLKTETLGCPRGTVGKHRRRKTISIKSIHSKIVHRWVL